MKNRIHTPRSACGQQPSAEHDPTVPSVTVTPGTVDGVKAQHFRAIWPILDPRRTLTALSDEAWPDLQVLAARARVQMLGRPRWCIRPGSDVPGSGGAHLVLVADVAVCVVPSNVDTWTGRKEAS